jgi:hypothetical protein
VKTVTFTFNGTQGLEDLHIDSTQPAFYGNTKKPLWGVEKTSRKFYIDEIPLLWGILDDAYENHPNISTVRQESLYLPGYVDDLFVFDGLQKVGNENLPASTFYKRALGAAYSVDGTKIEASTGDYSGVTNMAVVSFS